MEEEDFKSLSVEELCLHKSWKARLEGYTQVVKLFSGIDDQKSKQWSRFSGMMKSFVLDGNVLCQEKGLEAVLSFVENSASAAKSVNDIVSGVVQKCLFSPKKRIRELGLDIALMYMEIEEQNLVLDELLDGFKSKHPKIRAGSVQVLVQAVKDFGPKIIDINKTLKNSTVLIEDRDICVRQETKNLLALLWLWLGENFKQKLSSILKPNQLSEVTKEYEIIKDTPLHPKRFTRSEQNKSTKNNDALNSTYTALESLEDTPEVDEYDSLEPVNILNLIKEDFYRNLESKKWMERRDALEELEKILNSSPKLQIGNYSELIQALKKIISKDSNIVVVACAIRCLAGVAKGLRKNFKCEANAIILTLFEKFKEKKQNVVTALREAVDAVYVSTNLDGLQDGVLTSLEDKNPSIKAEVTAFLIRCFNTSPSSSLNKKNLKTLCRSLCKNLRDQDPTVRENSAEALGTAMKLVGEKTIKPFLTGVEDVCLKKINDYCSSAQIVKQTVIEPKVVSKTNKTSEYLTEPVKSESDEWGRIVKEKRLKKTRKKEKDQTCLTETLAQELSEEAKIPEEKINLKSKITESLLKELTHKNWKNRLDAVYFLQEIINSARSLTVNLGDCESVILERIQDNNNKISESAIILLETALKAMGPPSKRHLPSFLPVLLKAIGDQKMSIRNAAISCLDVWCEICGIEKFLEGPMVLDALKSGAPAAQAEIWSWLSSRLSLIPKKPIFEDMVSSLLIPLYSHLGGRHADLRKRSAEAVLGIMTYLGYQRMTAILENLGLAKSSVMSIKDILEKTRIHLPLKPLDKKGTKAADMTRINLGSTNHTDTISQINNGKETFMLQENNLKPQRFIDQEKLKWNSRTTKQEQTEHLKHLMVTAKVNPTLLSDMFHSDFRYQIRAIEILTEELPLNKEGFISNLDLILRWMVINIFDTNPSVLSKGLDFLKVVFTTLNDEGYNLMESEATGFLPHLLSKVGDSRDTVRNSVNAIIKLISNIYPPVKVIPYLLEGTKSKTARQRAECIELVSWMIGEFNIKFRASSVCYALKKIVALLDEREPTVRNAAVNCIVQVILNEGEDVLKECCNVGTKTMALLKERAKRATIISRHASLDKITDSSPIPHVSSSPKLNDNDSEAKELDAKPKGPFDLPEFEEVLTYRAPRLLEIDLQFMTEPTLGYSPEIREFLQKEAMNETLRKKSEASVNQMVRGVEKILTITNDLYNIGVSEKPYEIFDLIDKFVADIEELFNKLQGKTNLGVTYYNSAISALKRFFNCKGLCSLISEENLQKLLDTLLKLLNETQSNEDNVSLNRALNGIIVLLLDKANKTSTIFVLLSMLNTKNTSYVELVSRCLWKMTDSFSEWDHELDHVKILSRIDDFFKLYPKSIRKVGSQDIKLKTVKSLLLAMVKKRGHFVLQLAEMSPDISSDSETLSFICRSIRKKEAENSEDYFCDVEEKIEDGISSNKDLYAPENDHINTISQNHLEKESSLKDSSVSEYGDDVSARIKYFWEKLNTLKAKLGIPIEKTLEDIKEEAKNRPDKDLSFEEMEAIITNLRRICPS